jgi:hypothetical protein
MSYGRLWDVLPTFGVFHLNSPYRHSSCAQKGLEAESHDCRRRLRILSQRSRILTDSLDVQQYSCHLARNVLLSVVVTAQGPADAASTPHLAGTRDGTPLWVSPISLETLTPHPLLAPPIGRDMAFSGSHLVLVLLTSFGSQAMRNSTGGNPLPHLTTQWSGRPTAQARYSCVAPCMWAAAHPGR